MEAYNLDLSQRDAQDDAEYKESKLTERLFAIMDFDMDSLFERTKNAIVDTDIYTPQNKSLWIGFLKEHKMQEIKYHNSYDWSIPVAIKFREPSMCWKFPIDKKFEENKNEWRSHCLMVSVCIFDSPEETFLALSNAIMWYKSTTQE